MTRFAGHPPSGPLRRATRTAHRRPDGSPEYTNRLLLETSPYLQQHAHNPVNWYAWGDDAFAAARRLDRPVLVSIGYSTCHWCHVMEEESFEDLEIARVMNELYIPVKVDREVRPDVDAIYMQAVQMLSGGRGGWPLNVWLTPDRRPFFGGTYFPPRDGERGARTGFLTLLGQLRQVYDDQPDRVTEVATRIVGALQAGLGGNASPAGDLPDASTLRRAVAFYATQFDDVEGGLNRAPKFPSSLPVRLLLRAWRRTGDEQALAMATLTLRKMADGGMYDQAGGGFHRYSTDEKWLVPHFEKMLYDNALLVLAYLEGWQATGDESLAGTAREIVRYVRRDMTSPEGAFYSATDADSLSPEGHREEGYFFTWTPAELQALLGKEKAGLVASYYGVTSRGNFEGRGILHVSRPLAEVAVEFKVKPEEAAKIVAEAREAMYEARKSRPAPLRDEKILVAWNGLMISAFARAGLAFADSGVVAAAARAADFVLTRMREEGRLRRSFKDDRAEHPAYLEDYAFLVAGLIDLYEADADPRWLREALALQAVLDSHYRDPSGGYFTTADDHEKLLAREKPGYDGAEPSGNSVAALNLLRLAEFTSQDRYRAAADGILEAFASTLGSSPAALAEMLLALDYRLDSPREVVVVKPAAGADDGSLMDRFRALFVPNRILVVTAEGEELAAHAELVPLVSGKRAMDGKVTAYVCKQGVCRLPTSDPDELVRQLQGGAENVGSTRKPGS